MAPARKAPKDRCDAIEPPLHHQNGSMTLTLCMLTACSAFLRAQLSMDCILKQAELRCKTA